MPTAPTCPGVVLYASLIGVQVVEDVQLRHQVLVLREVEQAAMRALHALDPVVVAGRLRLCELTAPR